MTQELTNVEVDMISLVDRGANKRTLAVLKRAGGRVRLSKADPLPTFGQLAARAEFADWLPDALDALSSALYVAAYAEADVTDHDRLAAALDAVDQFRDALAENMAAVVVGVSKRSPDLRREGWKARM